ncbi:MAG: hypothetical protein ABIL09_24020 [Gemmatimonadota bacterium]
MILRLRLAWVRALLWVADLRREVAAGAGYPSMRHEVRALALRKRLAALRTVARARGRR